MIINDNLNKDLKSIENQALKENDKLCLKPEFGPNKIKYEHNLPQQILVKILCKELQIWALSTVFAFWWVKCSKNMMKTSFLWLVFLAPFSS